MKLIIGFAKGEYSSNKDEFKKLFSGKLKWVGPKDGWYSEDEYVRASQKMVPGMPVTFLIECDEKLKAKFEIFCTEHKVILKHVQNFDTITIINTENVSVIASVKLDSELDRVTYFEVEARVRGFSKSFIEKWGELIKADDARINRGESFIFKSDEDEDLLL